MTYRDDWRSERSKTGPFLDRDGNVDRWRSAQRDSDSASNYPDDREAYLGVGFQRRGWRSGSDYYGNDPNRYGGGNFNAVQFRGRGPKGYRRSDDRIREDACERLTQDDQLDASNIEVTVKDGEVTLSGSTNSREDKRRAEDIVDSVSGVRDVSNSLRVSERATQSQDRVFRPRASS